MIDGRRLSLESRTHAWPWRFSLTVQRPVDAGRMGANAVTMLGLLHVATATTAQLSRRRAAIVIRARGYCTDRELMPRTPWRLEPGCRGWLDRDNLKI